MKQYNIGDRRVFEKEVSTKQCNNVGPVKFPKDKDWQFDNELLRKVPFWWFKRNAMWVRSTSAEEIPDLFLAECVGICTGEWPWQASAWVIVTE